MYHIVIGKNIRKLLQQNTTTI